MRGRLEYIDILRGFAIFLVTLGHVSQYAGYGDGFLNQLIYSFHMPLFFAISGFVAAYGLRSKGETSFGFGQFVGRKFCALMIPYFAWNLVVHPFFFAGTAFSPAGYLLTCRSVFVDNASAWFLPCLFGLSVAFGVWALARQRAGRFRSWLFDVLLVGCLFALLLAVQHKTGNPFLRSIVSYYIPFFMGAFMGSYERLERTLSQRSAVFGMALVLFCLVSGFFVTSQGLGMVGKISRLIAGCASIPVCFALVRTWRVPPRLARWMCVIGRNTLVIYCLQNICQMPNVASWHLGFLLQCIVFGSVALLGMGMAALCGAVLSLNPVLSGLLLGKWTGRSGKGKEKVAVCRG